MSLLSLYTSELVKEMNDMRQGALMSLDEELICDRILEITKLPIQSEDSVEDFQLFISQVLSFQHLSNKKKLEEILASPVAGYILLFTKGFSQQLVPKTLSLCLSFLAMNYAMLEKERINDCVRNLYIKIHDDIFVFAVEDIMEMLDKTCRLIELERLNATMHLQQGYMLHQDLFFWLDHVYKNDPKPELYPSMLADIAIILSDLRRSKYLLPNEIRFHHFVTFGKKLIDQLHASGDKNYEQESEIKSPKNSSTELSIPEDDNIRSKHASSISFWKKEMLIEGKQTHANKATTGNNSLKTGYR